VIAEEFGIAHVAAQRYLHLAGSEPLVVALDVCNESSEHE
jgi:hypothetical protein